jgi:hypothetical protein
MIDIDIGLYIYIIFFFHVILFFPSRFSGEGPFLPEAESLGLSQGGPDKVGTR